MKTNLRIRPHHILCLNHFEGKGYSDEFVQNMKMIHNIVNCNEDTVITIENGSDIVCSACPHNCSGKCESDDKVNCYDSRVLNILGISFNKEYGWNELCRLYKEKIDDKGRLSEICKACKWLDICNK